MTSRTNRVNEEKYSNDGCLMKIIEYNSATDIVVEFQDKYHYRVSTSYGNFKKGTIKIGVKESEKKYIIIKVCL